jgi:translation elongation factor EF-Ts
MTPTQRQILKDFRDDTFLPLKECKQYLEDNDWDTEKAKKDAVSKWLHTSIGTMDKNRYY